MRFDTAYDDWRSGKLTQEEAARLLNVHERKSRRYINRYHEDGEQGLLDKRISEVSQRRAPADEVLRLETLYKTRYDGWQVKHFYTFYKSHHCGSRSYTWVKNRLQSAGLVAKAKGKGRHRKRRERSPMPGMRLHQDASTHLWGPGVYWDLVVTMDDATSEHYSMVFVDEEGTFSSMLGVQQVLERRGLFCSLYTDRGSHYWMTPEAGGKVSKTERTQFGRAMEELGIEMIAAYSPEARGRSERALSTHQQRLPRELALYGIKTMADANRYLQDYYLPAFNAEFACKPAIDDSAFVPLIDHRHEEVLCEHFQRTVDRDNTVSFQGKKLQIPSSRARAHYMKVRVRVHRYIDQSLASFHGPKCLARYSKDGKLTYPVIETTVEGPQRQVR